MKMKIFMMAAIILSSKSHAQEDSTKLLDDLVITATRNPIKQALTGKVITVINREELDRNSGKTLTEVLNTHAGIFVTGSNSVLGTNQDVYLRGASAGKTLILIDGVPVYDVAGISGAYDLNFISADQVEKVEILKGSQSTLYGSDAIAGVINVITRKGGAKKIMFNANLSAGSYATYRGTVGVDGTIKKTRYNVQYTKSISNGFSAAHDEAGNNNFEKDGFDENAVQANVQQQLTSRFSLHAKGQFSNYTTDVDADRFTDDLDYRVKTKNFLAAAGASYKMGKSLLHLNYSYNRTERNYFNDSVPPVGFEYFSEGNYDGKSHFAELYTNLYVTKYLDVLVGADFRHQSTDQNYSSVSFFGPFTAPPLGDTARVKQFGAYASVVLKDFSGFSAEIGGRYNNFSKYGDVFTFSFSPSYLINNKLKIFANIASGFKAPSLYQVYSEYRNTDGLDPEKSLSIEGGIQYFRENINIRALYFLRNVKDNIEFFSAGPPNYESYYINADKQKDKGFELEAQVVLGKVRLRGNYTNLDGYLQTTANNKDTTFFNLYRRPKQTINLNVGVDINKQWSLNGGIQSVGKRKEGVFNAAPIDMPAYYVWNLYSSYAITKNFKAYVDLKNITDEQYFEVRGYNSRRFNFMAGVSLKF